MISELELAALRTWLPLVQQTYLAARSTAELHYIAQQLAVKTKRGASREDLQHAIGSALTKSRPKKAPPARARQLDLFG